MMKIKGVVADDSENEFDIDDPEVYVDSEDKWLPPETVSSFSTYNIL